MSELLQILQQKRQQHVEAIQAIDQLLAIEGAAGLPATGKNVPAPSPKKKKANARAGAVKGSLTRAIALRKTLEQARKPLGLSEVVEGMKRVGFQFVSADPKNSLNSLLYGKGRPAFIGKTEQGFFLKK